MYILSHNLALIQYHDNDNFSIFERDNILDIDYYSTLETAYLSNYESDKDKSYDLTLRMIR